MAVTHLRVRTHMLLDFVFGIPVLLLHMSLKSIFSFECLDFATYVGARKRSSPNVLVVCVSSLILWTLEGLGAPGRRAGIRPF
jgi:hypothetical protein